jgi:hypothetical protein
MPQALGSFGGHIGTGKAAAVALLKLRAVVLEWAVETAPVRARAMTKARIMVFFIVILSLGYETKLFRADPMSLT